MLRNKYFVYTKYKILNKKFYLIEILILSITINFIITTYDIFLYKKNIEKIFSHQTKYNLISNESFNRNISEENFFKINETFFEPYEALTHIVRRSFIKENIKPFYISKEFVSIDQYFDFLKIKKQNYQFSIIKTYH